MIELALVGCGHIHTPNFVKRINARSDVTVKMVWDHDEARAQLNASQLDAVAVTDLAAVWQDEAVSAVVICSETDRHGPLVLAACAANKDMFVEKPLGVAKVDADRMAAAIESAGVRFQTGYFMRGYADYQFVRSAIRQGHFGQVTRIRMSNCHDGALIDRFTPDWLWMTDPEVAGGGGFGDLGTHILDIILWLIDAEVKRVTATIDTALGRYGEDCDEYGEGILHFSNGVIASLAAGWVDVADPVKLVISGTEGHAYVVDNNLFFKSKHVAGADGLTPWQELPPAWPHAFELFLDAVVGAKPPSGQAVVPLVTPREAARRSAVMAALYQGAMEQRWISHE